MNTLAGHLSDGRFLRSDPVVVEFTADGHVRVRGESLTRDLPLSQLRISEPLGALPRFLYLPDGEVIETHDTAPVDRALAVGGRGRAARLIHALERHRGFAAAATLIVILCVSATFYYGLPVLARRVASRVPPAVQEQAGQVALTAISQYLEPSSLSRGDRERVRRQLVRLLPERTAETLPRLEFRSMNTSPNVFALPGDIILVSDEFVHLADHDDQIAAVLAHEIGHLEKRHGLQSALRSSFALLFATTVTGDLSTLTAFAGTVPFLILQNGYSRDLEREADDYAHALLVARKIDLRHFGTILRKLEEAQPRRGPDISYLSTHPSTESRILRYGFHEQPVAGSSVTPFVPEPDVAPVPLSTSQPTYPFDLRRAGISGEVIVTFIVDHEGNVRDAAAESSTHKDFEGPAIRAVQEWKFTPGLKDGRPTDTRMSVPVQFNVTD